MVVPTAPELPKPFGSRSLPRAPSCVAASACSSRATPAWSLCPRGTSWRPKESRACDVVVTHAVGTGTQAGRMVLELRTRLPGAAVVVLVMSDDPLLSWRLSTAAPPGSY